MQLAFDLDVEQIDPTPTNLHTPSRYKKRGAPMPQLDLDLEPSHETESKAMTLLAEYRTIDSDLTLFRSHAAGDDLPVMPSAGARSLVADADSRRVLRLLAKLGHDPVAAERGGEPSEPLDPDLLTVEQQWEIADQAEWDREIEKKPELVHISESEQTVIDCIRRYVSPQTLQEALRREQGVMPGTHVWYASVHRLRALLDRVNGQSANDLELIAGVKAMLDEHMQAQGEAVKLTQTEALAQARWAWIERAREIVRVLEENKAEVGKALDSIAQDYRSEHDLLWWQYVQGESLVEVYDRLHLSVDMHRGLRKRAMGRFISRCPVMMLRTGAVDSWQKQKRGRK